MQPVSFLEHKLHFRPREVHDIRIELFRLTISPAYDISWQRDVYGNSVALVAFTAMSGLLKLVSTVVVEHYETALVTLALSETAKRLPLSYDEMEKIDVVPHQTAAFADDQAAVGELIANIWRPGGQIDTFDFLAALNRWQAIESGSASFDAQALHLSPQGTAIDIQHLGGQYCVAVSLAQDLLDKLAIIESLERSSV